MLPIKFLSIWPSCLSVSKKILRNQPTRKKNGLWWSCLLTDQDEMSNLYYWWPSIDASYSFDLFAQAVSEKIFWNWPTRKKKLPRATPNLITWSSDFFIKKKWSGWGNFFKIISFPENWNFGGAKILNKWATLKFVLKSFPPLIFCVFKCEFKIIL